MREVEFLPAWYPQIRKRKRLVVLQAWMTIVLIIGLGLYMFLAQRNLRIAQGSLRLLDGEISQSNEELRKLDDLLTLQKQWRQQDLIFSKLGMHIDATRLLTALDGSMPTEMTLLDMNIQTEEQTRVVSSLAGAGSRKNREQMIDRRMRVELLGVVPTDVDLANFLARMAGVPYLEQVTLLYARDRTDRGHLMREFKMTFALNLNPPEE